MSPGMLHNLPMLPRLVSGAMLAVLAACGGPDPGRAWLEGPVPLAVPAAPGSRFPNLVADGGGALMSWLEPAAAGAFALRYARYADDHWTPPATVASGRDWFVNWADFPSIVASPAGLRAAHWLEQRPGNVYAYDVRLATSADAGRNWTAPWSPHDDGTATEHGFVTLLPEADGFVAVWLDGRHTSGEHEHAGGGAMTLRSAKIRRDGLQQGPDIELDGRVCDCCQTDAALAREGPVVVYRDRSDAEIRNIAVTRLTADGWSEPAPVANDGWKIAACPVNGPAIDARDDTVVVAWFTAPDRPRVRLAFSRDGGRRFARPIEVAAGGVAGRVDVVLLAEERAVVSWIADGPGGGRLLARVFTPDGAAGEAVTVAQADVARSSGFPQMVRVDGALLFAWTRPGDPSQVLAAVAKLR